MPRDLVEFYRSPFYQHWGVHDGYGYVIHVTGEPNTQCSFGSFDITAGSSSAVSGNVDAEVKNEKLEKAANGDKCLRNNLQVDKFLPLPPYKVVRRAF